MRIMVLWTISFFVANAAAGYLKQSVPEFSDTPIHSIYAEHERSQTLSQKLSDDTPLDFVFLEP